MRGNNFKLLSLSIFAGLLMLGFYVNKSRDYQGTLTVKGLAEKKVTASKAIWNLSGNYRGTSSVLKYRVSNHINGVREFLISKGFNEKEISVEGVNYDLDYKGGNVYTANVNVKLNSKKIDLVSKTYSEIYELMKGGIVISGGKWNTAPRYYIESFQDIKEDLLKDACLVAKKSAKNIVKNMGKDIALDKVLFINQGVLTINPADNSSNSHEFYKDKVYRLVSTVKYSLD